MNYQTGGWKRIQIGNDNRNKMKIAEKKKNYDKHTRMRNILPMLEYITTIYDHSVKIITVIYRDWTPVITD